MTEPVADRRLAAILAADVAGYSRLMAAQERSTLDTLRQYRQYFDEQIARHHGRIVNTAGDAVLAEFASPVAALECAVAVQTELAKRNSSLPPHRAMEFRMGINLGDVIAHEGTIYGDGVNIAARLEGLAESGGIIVSGNVYDLLHNKVEHLFVFEGRKRVKNIPEPVRVYSIVPKDTEAQYKAAQRRRKLYAGGMIVVVSAVVLAAGLYSLGPFTSSTRGDVKPLGVRLLRDCPNCPELVEIPRGAFLRGSTASEAGHQPTEGPVTKVEIQRNFAIGRYPVTFGEWDQCLADRACQHNPNDRGWGRGTRPVMYVSWHDVQEFITWLSSKTGKLYRLPSEAEWEYAARAGSTTAYPWGDQIIPGLANCQGCMDTPSEKTSPVGTYPPNRYNLFDMHGNVWQWVADCWNASYAGAPADGSARLNGECDKAVVRGGAWGLSPSDVRSARREGDRKDLQSGRRGFRVARDFP